MNNHLYLLDTRILKDTNLYNSWYGMMPPERKEKIDRFRFDKDKYLSLGAGILLHKALLHAGEAETDGVNRADQKLMALSYGRNGKPYVSGREDIHFNISHSGYMAACALSSRPVGVDMEKDRKFKDSLIRHAFLDQEIRYIKDHCKETDAAFTDLWTIKESIMKYYGTGIALDPKKISVDLREPVRARCEGHEADRLHLTRYRLEGCHLTVCSEYADFSREPEWITLSQA